jgi:non-ribosomal peptide synthetase component F
MPPAEFPSLWALIAQAGLPERRFVADARSSVAWRDLSGQSSLSVDGAACRGQSVVIAARAQMPAVLAAVELDGVAARIVLCPPDVPRAQLPEVAARAGAGIVLTDDDGAGARCGLPLRPADAVARDAVTEWVLFTSGTTGRPKLLIHTLAGLTGPLDDGLVVAKDAVWSTFYDIRRYGGLQILLRACLGGGSMVLSDAAEPVAGFLQRAGEYGVTHISGTPSHWRRALMSGEAAAMAPDYVRLSGEVVPRPRRVGRLTCGPGWRGSRRLWWRRRGRSRCGWWMAVCGYVRRGRRCGMLAMARWTLRMRTDLSTPGTCSNCGMGGIISPAGVRA